MVWEQGIAIIAMVTAEEVRTHFSSLTFSRPQTDSDGHAVGRDFREGGGGAGRSLETAPREGASSAGSGRVSETDPREGAFSAGQGRGSERSVSDRRAEGKRASGTGHASARGTTPSPTGGSRSPPASARTPAATPPRA